MLEVVAVTVLKLTVSVLTFTSSPYALIVNCPTGTPIAPPVTLLVTNDGSTFVVTEPLLTVIVP